MFLHGETISLRDGVFDVSLQRGHGVISEIRATGTFDVRFRDNFIISYGSNGVQLGEAQRTLYWHDPGTFVMPMKHEPLATLQRDHISTFRAALLAAQAL